MQDIYTIIYILLTVGIIFYFLSKKASKIKNPLEGIEELMLRQAEDLDEKNKIIIELYDKLYRQKDWIPNPKNKDSKVANSKRSKSTKRRVKE